MKKKLFSHFRIRARIIFLSAFLLCSPAFINACDFCGAFLGITPFENQNAFGIAHRYRVFNGYQSMGQHSEFFPSGAYRLANPPSALHGTASDSAQTFSQSDFESYKIFELRARYFFHPRFEINAIVPLADNKQKSTGEETHVTGFGDISVFIGWHAIQKLDATKIRQRLIVGLGIKIPTGRTDFVYEDGDRIPVMLQAGTGSADGFAYLTYAAAKKNWRWGATLLGKYNGTNKYDEQVLPSTVNSGFVAYQFHTCSWIFLPQLQIYEEYTKGIQEGIQLMDGTGMNMVLAGPGADICWKKFSLNVGAQLPLYQKTDEMNMKTSGRLMVGITYNFDAAKYILK